MKKHQILFKKTTLTLALILTFSFGAFAQSSGTYTLTDGQNYTSNIVLNGNVTYHVPSGTATISGVISNPAGPYLYTVTKTGNGKLIFTGLNTYPGITYVNAGTLQIGNGITGTTKSCAVIISSSSAILRFEPGQDYACGSEISGSGSVQYKGIPGVTNLYLYANNTYTGTTTIEQGRLYIGEGGANGMIAGNVIVNEGAYFGFCRNNNHTYSGTISGAGNVWIRNLNNATTTLSGVNTYTGVTDIGTSTLALSSTGQIENSSQVLLSSSSSKFDISASNKKVKSIEANFGNAEIILGNKRLVIGTDGQADGGGTFVGKFTGTGGWIDKYGTGTLTLSGASTYTGDTWIYQGTVVFSAANNFGTGTIHFPGAGTKTLRWASGNTADISGRLGLLDFNTSTTNTVLDVGTNNVTFASNFKSVPTTSTLTKAGTGKLTITAANTFGGYIVVSAGTLQIGNGTSGSIANVLGANIFSGATLRFEPGANMAFNVVIVGDGKVEYKGAASGKDLYLTANNTYTGTTTIEAGNLRIGNNTSTGAIAGNITHNGSYLVFDRTSDYTYTGVISGSGKVGKDRAAKVTLTGVNTYTGITEINAGTLQIGNGTSGSIANTSGVSFLSNAGTLRFEPGAPMTFSKIISGDGKVEYKGDWSTRQLYFTANNTYTGTTTIVAGDFYIGKNTTTGDVAGDIIVQSGYLNFYRSNDYTYSKIISGNCEVWKEGAGKATLNGVNTYKGPTAINEGTLALGANGKIENSDYVSFNDNTKFDISAGDKKIKGIWGLPTSTEVILGGKTLTIGTTGVNEGDDSYYGKFTGTGGGVTKLGTNTLTLNNTANTATGTFSHNEGLLKMTGKWAGNFTKSTSASLEVLGEVTIGGNFTISGGNITMNLNTTPKAKISVTGNVIASGTNTLNITTAAITNYALMIANSGINNTTPYTLNMPGMTGTLSVSAPNQLLLTATVSDNTPPVPGNSGTITGTASVVTATINWTAGSDNATPTNQLRYYVYRSLSNNITSVANCEANGTLLNTGGTQDITTYNVVELTTTTTYYFNVVVADMVGNKAAYVTKSLTTDKAVLAGSVNITGNTVFGETLTANTDGLTSLPEVELGALTYQWKRNGANIGGNSSTYTLVEADVAYTISVTVTAANCNSSVSSYATEPIQKAAQTAPAAPTKASVTGSSITLNTMQGCEYRMNGGDWQTSPVFTGLQPKTTYVFEAYKPETATHLASPTSPTAFIATEDAGVGVETITNDELRITVYPNPTTGELNIQSSTFKVQNVEVFDISGRKCHVSRVTRHENIDISDLPNGAYFLRIATENGVVTKKVIKQ